VKNDLQNATRKISGDLIEIKEGYPDTISFWIAAYFRYEVTTSVSSQKVQKRDLALFRDFMISECGREDRPQWSPRLSKAFADRLKKKPRAMGRAGYSDQTINRILAHLKTFAKWIHKLKPFPLDNPMAKIKLVPVGTGLEVERAITASERRRILDAADRLPVIGGRSKDRSRYRGKERPMRKGYRPYRNRAIVYTLIETGMRRAAIRNIDLADVDFERRLVSVEEKGGRTHGYKNSREGISAIEDYVAKERTADFKKWKSPALFLSPATNTHGDGRLNSRVINTVWNEVCELAGAGDHTPHAARHAMGRHLIEKTGNIAAVQRQLGHTNAAYSIQYARITDQELAEALDDR
jgi:integrase